MLYILRFPLHGCGVVTCATMAKPAAGGFVSLDALTVVKPHLFLVPPSA